MRQPVMLLIVALIAGCGGTATVPSIDSPVSTPAPTSTPTGAASSATALPTPQSATSGPCPSAEPLRPLTVSELAQAGAFCFGSRDVSVRGFLGPPPAIGWEPPFIVKPWSWPPGGWVLWERGPGGDAISGGGNHCPWLGLNVRDGASVDFSAAPGWVVVTGHRLDPAAETCTLDGVDDPVAIEQAREECRLDFVLTSIRAIPTP